MRKTAVLLLLVLFANGWTLRASSLQQVGQVITTTNAAQIRQVGLLAGHSGDVFAIAFSPDGKLLASGGIDYSVRLWDIPVGTQKALLNGHTKQVASVSFIPDGLTLLSTGYDQTVRLWNVQTGALVQTQGGNSNSGIAGPQVSNLFTIFNREGTLLAYNVDGDSLVYIWDVKNKLSKALGTAGVTTASYGPIAFSNDGKWLASPLALSDTEGNTIVLWPLADLTKQSTLNSTLKLSGPSEAYYSNAIVFSPDSSQLAVLNSDDNAIHLFDVKSGKMLKSLAFHTTAAGDVDIDIYGLAYSPDGSLLAAASHDRTIHIWDVKAGKELITLTGRSEPSAITFSPDGKLIASANLDGTIELWGVK